MEPDESGTFQGSSYLYATPQVHVCDIGVQTLFDSSYEDATLRVTANKERASDRNRAEY